jgi:cytochrome P450
MTEQTSTPPQDAAVREHVLPDGRPVWLVTRYEEARRLLNDPRFSNDTRRMGRKAPLAGIPEEITSVVAADMLNNDPPEHTRLRRSVAHAFTARRIAGFRPHAERIAEELLDTLRGRTEADLVEDYAGPMATRALAALIGVPVADCERVRKWSETFVLELLSVSDQLMLATKSLTEYARELVDRKRADPGDDLLSTLIGDGGTDDGGADDGGMDESGAHDGGARGGSRRMTDEEAASMVFILLIAGQLATSQLVAKGCHLLLTHPGELARLRADPSLMPAAVAEFLRYDPPLRVSAFRMATEPVELGGHTIPAGDVAICSLLDANHDERRFPHPERLDVCRTGNQHLAFSQGIHRCLGGNLAELEAEVAIGALLRRYGKIRLAGSEEQVEWAERGLMRQLVRLPVVLG